VLSSVSKSGKSLRVSGEPSHVRWVLLICFLISDLFLAALENMPSNFPIFQERTQSQEETKDITLQITDPSRDQNAFSFLKKTNPVGLKINIV
jgi:hypothetical protein